MICDTNVTIKDTSVVCKVYNANGKLIRLKRYLNGKKHGIQEEYFNSGIKNSVIHYNNGCLIDSSIFYHENGRVRSTLYYLNCLCNGPVIVFNENGDTIQKSISVNDKTIGPLENWYSPGKRSSIINYNNSGKKHGLYETWREDGTRKDSIVYDNGKMIEVREYFVDGKERMWEEYKRGEKLLLWNALYHDRSGKICGKVIKGDGEYILYDENGKYPSRSVISKGVTIKEEEM
jgi:antitoxin component YwqK of YwqJK toxin-antitoxin module